MPEKTRIRIAALVTATFLAGISALGLATHTHGRTAASAAPSATVVQQQQAAAPAIDLEHESDE